MSELISYTEYGEFFDEVLKLDQNVRFTAIHDGRFKGKYQKGIQGYFREKEIKSALVEAQNRWESRKKLSFKIGEPKFAMAQYSKINRITIPFGKEGIILVTTELDVDIEKLVEEIFEIRDRIFS